MARYRLIIGNQNYSSWSLRAWLPLEHHGLDYEVQKIWLFSPSYQEELSKASSSKKVPVLMDSQLTDQPIWDSLAISEHLVQEHPELPLWPKDPRARAFARSLTAEIHSSFAELREQMPMNCKRHGIDVQPDQACLQDIARVNELVTQGRGQFADQGQYLAGHFSLADTMFAPIVWRFNSYVDDLPEVVAEYCETMRALPAMKTWEEQSLAETQRIERYDHIGRVR